MGNFEKYPKLIEDMKKAADGDLDTIENAKRKEAELALGKTSSEIVDKPESTKPSSSKRESWLAEFERRQDEKN